MAVEQAFQDVKLFVGFTYKSDELYRQTKERLQQIFSSVHLEAGPFAFDLTDYYHRELGSPLFKSFAAFRDLIDPGQLPDIKCLTNKIEQESARSGKRRINIDPGILSGGNVILATTKNYYHRVPLQKGIYAHLEYVIKKNRVTPLEWTYPDFRTPHYMEFFNTLIPLYKEQLKRKDEGAPIWIQKNQDEKIT